MKPAKTLSRGLYITENEKIVAFERVEIYENVYNAISNTYTDTVALVTWVDDKGVFPRTMISKSQFKRFYRLGGL